MLLCKILYTGTRKIKRKKEKKGKNERRRKKRENNYRNVLAMLKKKDIFHFLTLYRSHDITRVADMLGLNDGLGLVVNRKAK